METALHYVFRAGTCVRTYTHMQMEKETGTRKANGKGLAAPHRKKQIEHRKKNRVNIEKNRLKNRPPTKNNGRDTEKFIRTKDIF